MAEAVTRRELIQKLRALGFEGPFPGGRHQYMRKGKLRLTIPNPHRSGISLPLLRNILEQAGIGWQEWESD